MKNILSIVSFFPLLVKSHGFFFSQTMSLVQVNDHKSFKALERNKSCVVLIAGKGCRACMRFKNPFYLLTHAYEHVDMYEITLNDVTIEEPLNTSIRNYTKHNGVKTIPSVLFQNEGSVSLISGTRNNLEVIEEMIRNM